MHHVCVYTVYPYVYMYIHTKYVYMCVHTHILKSHAHTYTNIHTHTMVLRGLIIHTECYLKDLTGNC